MSFTWDSPVFLDELDLDGTLHTSRFAVHIERAQTALFEQLGKGWSAFAQRDDDLRYVVRALHIEFQAAFTSPGMLRVVLTADKIGTTSAVYGFQCGHYARGYRVVVKVDPEGRPAPWSDWYRRMFADLQG